MINHNQGSVLRVLLAHLGLIDAFESKVAILDKKNDQLLSDISMLDQISEKIAHQVSYSNLGSCSLHWETRVLVVRWSHPPISPQRFPRFPLSARSENHLKHASNWSLPRGSQIRPQTIQTLPPFLWYLQWSLLRGSFYSWRRLAQRSQGSFQRSYCVECQGLRAFVE